jgi:FixJ family two-component response regulator
MANVLPSLGHRKPLAEANSSGVAAPIWLLDDDHSMLKALARLFRSVGLALETFSEPASFLERIAQEHCRVAILDMFMPGMNGLEVQALVREASPRTRIIFISGRDDPGMRASAIDAGAFGYVAKPFGDDELLNLVQRAFE